MKNFKRQSRFWDTKGKRERESERTRENEWEYVREKKISVCKQASAFVCIYIYILYIVYAHCTVIRATLLSVSVVSGNIRARKLFSCIMNE